MTDPTGKQFCGRETVVTSRREFLSKSGLGFGSLAAGYLLGQESVSAATSTSPASNPFAPKAQHFPAKAKSVIFLFMHGGPSHLDTFDPKPLLNDLDGQLTPPSFGK